MVKIKLVVVHINYTSMPNAEIEPHLIAKYIDLAPKSGCRISLKVVRFDISGLGP